MGCGGTGERGLSHGPSRCAPGGAAGRGGSADWRGGGRGCEEPFPSGCAGRVGASLPAAPPARDTQRQGLFFAPGTVATLGTRSLNAGGDVIPSCSTSSCLGLFQRSTGAYESSSSVMQPVPGCPKHCPDAPEWVSASKAAPATVGPADSSAGSPSSLCCTLPPGNHVGVELLLLLQRDSAHLGIKGLCIPFQILGKEGKDIKKNYRHGFSMEHPHCWSLFHPFQAPSSSCRTGEHEGTLVTCSYHPPVTRPPNPALPHTGSPHYSPQVGFLPAAASCFPTWPGFLTSEYSVAACGDTGAAPMLLYRWLCSSPAWLISAYCSTSCNQPRRVGVCSQHLPSHCPQ